MNPTPLVVDNESYPEIRGGNVSSVNLSCIILIRYHGNTAVRFYVVLELIGPFPTWQFV